MRALRYMGVRTTHFPTVTLAGLTCNLSMVDGTAFITNPSVDLTPYVGCKITLTDTSGYKAVGWIKAKGSAETLGDETLDTWSNVSGSSYETFTLNANGHDIDSAINDVGGIGWAHSNRLGSTGILSKWECARTLASGTAPSLSMSGVPGGAAVDMVSKIAADSQTIYTTLTGARYLNIYVINVASNFSATHSFKQVLTPSATGVTITSSLDGATFNWFAKHSGFLPNAASFTAIIEG
jgi:hypothetical protein